ncbi:MAG: hypothetical protein ACLUS6_11850 [Dysosmobacter sp.]
MRWGKSRDSFKGLPITILPVMTKMRNVGGIAQTEAQKSSDLLCHAPVSGRAGPTANGVIFATGTPISNSMAELYTIQRYLQYQTFCRRWALSTSGRFGPAEDFGETAVDGHRTGPRRQSATARKLRFAKFFNLSRNWTATFRMVGRCADWRIC